MPILADFSDLEFGDKVYSRKFGIGKFLRLHYNEAVIEFSDRRVRVAPDEHDISLVAKYTRKRGRNRMSCEIAGEKVSFKKFKQMMAEDIAENFIAIEYAMDLLKLKPKNFVSLCKMYKVKINKFGIRKKDLLKLKDMVFLDKY